MERLSVPQGDLDLERYPARPNETRRAWDAADEYLLHHLTGLDDGTPVDLTGHVLVVNDGSGALAVALALGMRDRVPRAPSVLSSLSDSYLSRAATATNLARNSVEPATVSMLASFDTPAQAVDVLLVKVPTSLALLEDQLRRLTPFVGRDTVIIGAAMARHIHTSTLDIFERIFGPTRTSLAWRKARLIFSTPRGGLEVTAAAQRWPWPVTFTVDGGGPVVVNHAGVFSAERLDIGTRFFVEHLPRRTGPELVVDLGCGNGIVGTVAALANPEATVAFIDESSRAISSADATYHANHPRHDPGGPAAETLGARFVAGNGLLDLADEPPIGRTSIDLVLCNPPFHADHAVGDATAWQMFSESREVLRPGGELWIVGNRHLGYHAKLKRLFGNCEVAASNTKFVVLRARR